METFSLCHWSNDSINTICSFVKLQHQTFLSTFLIFLLDLHPEILILHYMFMCHVDDVFPFSFYKTIHLYHDYLPVKNLNTAF